MTAGLPPRAAWCTGFQPLPSFNERSAPDFRRYFTAWRRPLSEATISGVKASLASESISATWLAIRSIISGSPPCEAKCNEFHPLLSTIDISAPFSIRYLTARSLPLKAAIINGVLWVLSCESIQIPSERRDFILLISPSLAAVWSWFHSFFFSLKKTLPRTVNSFKSDSW